MSEELEYNNDEMNSNENHTEDSITKVTGMYKDCLLYTSDAADE